MTLSRRQLFGATLGLGGAILALPAPALASPLVALQLAVTALSLVQSFSQSDNGLSAMLQTQIALQRLALSELQHIDAAIATLSQQVSQLDDKIKAALAEQFSFALISQIAGASSRYIALLNANSSDGTIFSNPAVKDRVRDIARDVAQARSQLTGLPQGFRAGSATIIPVACATEIACMARLKYPPAVIREVIGEYAQWFSDICTPGRGIDAEISGYVADHDANIKRLAVTPWFKDIGIEQFYVSGSQTATSMSTCIATFEARIDQPSQMKSIRRWFISQGSMYGGSAAYQQRMVLKSKYDDSTRAWLIDRQLSDPLMSFVPKAGPPWDISKYIVGEPVSDDTLCDVLELTPRFNNDADALAYIQQQLPYRTSVANQSSLEAELDHLNLLRSQIAFASYALAIVLKARSKATELSAIWGRA